MSKFSKLAQANVDFYNEHPVAHTAILVGYTVIALVAINSIAKLAMHPESISIQYK